MSKTFWNKMYESTPLDQIPWQKTQADWFSSLLDEGAITGKKALDLGCGTGTKSIQLVKAGFETVIGIDVSARAIEYAKKNSQIASVEEHTTFIKGDATELSTITADTFDLVLDWAVLHCIPEDKRQTYVQGIIEHTHEGSQYLLRAFARTDDESKEYFVDHANNSEAKIYLFNDTDVKSLFGNKFRIIRTNTSKPRTKTGRIFKEYLMVRK